MTSHLYLTRRVVLSAVGFPVLAAGLQGALWSYLHPFSFLLFYPAVFCSAWVGGLPGGLIATVVAAALALYYFVPPALTFEITDPNALLSVLIFSGMGGLFSAVFAALQRANLRLDLLAQLQASTANLKKSQAVAHVGHWTWNVRSNQLSWSDEMYRIFGLNPIDFSGDLDDVVRAAIHPADRAKVEQVNQAVRLAGQPVPLDYRVVWPDGTVRVVHAEPAEQTFDAQGHIIQLWGIVQDITLRQQVQAALRQSEALFSTIFQSSPMGIHLFRLADGRSMQVNDAFLDLIGYSREEVVGHTAAELQLFSDPAARIAWLHVLQTGQAVRNQDARIRRKSGEVRDVLASLDRLEINGEDVILVIATDITDRKQAERRLAYLARSYATLSQVNQAIVRVKTRPELFDSLCQVAVDFGEFQLAWIGLLDRATGQLTAVAQRGQGANRLATGCFDLNQAPLRAGVMATAVFTDRVVLSHALPAESEWAQAEQLGYPSMATIPLREQGQVIGALNLYGPLANFAAADEEHNLLAEMGLDISFALDTLRLETERQQAAAALRESEERYRLISENSADVIWVLDPLAGRFTYVSPSVEKLRGYTPAEVMAQPVEQALTPDSLKQVSDSLAKNIPDFMAQGHGTLSYVSEVDQPRKDGSIVHTEVTTTYLFDAQGRVQIVGVSRDITARQQAEAALRASEERYQQFIAQSFEAIYRTEFDQPIDTTLPVEEQIDLIYEHAYMAECNQATADMYHRSVAQMIGLRLIEAHGGKDNPVNRAAFRKFIAAGYKSMADETLEYTSDGQPVWFLSNTVGMVDNGRLLRLWGTSLDITARKQAEAALRQSEERYRMLFKNMTEGFFQAELIEDETGQAVDFRFVDVNPAHGRIIGLSRDQVLGKTASELFPNLEDSWYMAIAKVVHTGEPLYVEGFVAVTGRYYANSYFSPAPGQFASLFSDITERKQAEAELHRLNAELEQRVAQRTAQLAAANERLTELDRLKSKFVSDVSHELRTPVTSLSLYIDLLEHGKPEKREHYVGKLKDQMTRVHTLINDILDLSRLERDPDEGGRLPIDLNSIAEHISALERGTAEAAGLTLTCEVTEGLVVVVARPDQLTRALTNLVSNAIKYTPHGSIRVQTGQQGRRVFMAVTDTGLGIPADELPHVFERFYRGHAVAQSTIPGTGLGLSIVKEIIESHGGTVEVESVIGVGSTFRVWLPSA